MGGLRRSVAVASAALAFCAATRGALAQLVLVAPDDRAPRAIAHAELGYARGSGPPVTWLSLRLARGPAAVVAALPEGAAVGAGLDAWFAALETTASPNVLLPRGATDCGKTASYAHVSWWRDAGAPATELVLQSREDVAAALGAQGLAEPADLPSADRYVIWSWSAADAPLTTRTLRVVGGAEPLPLAPGAPLPVLFSSLSNGPEVWPGEVGTSELDVTFVAGKPTSDYGYRLQDFLEARREPLLEARLSEALFDWSILADTLSLRPLADSYALGAGHEQPDIDVDDCARQLRGLREADAAGAVACGDALDFGLALAATGAERPTLQRFVVSGVTGVTPAALENGGEPSRPLLRARSIDDSACPEVAAPPTIVNDPPAPDGDAGRASSGATTVETEDSVVVDYTPVADAGCSCDAGRDPDYDDRASVDCSSDTSSDYDSSEGDCSADSSSSSDDSGCASDTSSSSSSGSDDTSCDGGSEDSGYDGDTCTGRAAPGAEPSQKVQANLAPARASRPRRVRTSLWSLALVALALPIRRRKRGQIAGG